MSDATRELDALLEKLERATSGSGDAIDHIVNGPRRKTDARSIRNDPAMLRFRRELADGLIRADTANQLLRLVSQVIGGMA